MLLQPKKLKFKKFQKGRRLGGPKSCSIVLGSYALCAKESGYVNARQLEAARQTINRHLQRQGRIWIRVFPDYGVTKKPTEIRMGKGKGKVDHWACKIRAGIILFEIDGVNFTLAQKAFVSGAHKLPLSIYLKK
jgi:large subunit ribosomal protein L16